MTREDYLDELLKISVAKTNPKKQEQSANPNKYPQGHFKNKKCRLCGSYFSPKAPSELYCSDKCKDYGVTEAYLKRTYNITIKEYLDIAERQGFTCAICHKPNFAMKNCHSGALVVDHDHTTGKVRGLLCHNCNRALGLLQDSISSLHTAITYLEGVTTISQESTSQANGDGKSGLR